MADNLKILNQPSLGQILGQGLGTGLGSGLQALAQQKLQQMAARQLVPGLTNEQAQSFPLIPQNVQQQLIKEQLSQPAVQKYQQSLQELLSGKPTEEFEVPKEVTEKQATELTKLALGEKTKKQKLESAEQARIDKSTQPYFDQIINKAEGAKTGIKRLDRMKELIRNGNLPSSLFYNAFKGLEEFESHIPFVGGIVNALIRPIGSVLRAAQKGIVATDTEEFEKLSNDFVREAKNIFGNRITNLDLETFMKLIPTLSQTDKGKLAIIRNIENIFQADKVLSKSLKQIIKENGGKRPKNLEFLVQKKAKKRLDQLAERFVKGLSARGETEEINPKEEMKKINLSFGS